MTVAATKSKEDSKSTTTSKSHTDEEEEANSSFKIIRRRKTMQLAAPKTVMAGSMGYSKAAQYTTINRVDVKGAEVRYHRPALRDRDA